jgi:hypothetical protein
VALQQPPAIFTNEAKTRELFRGGWLDSGDQAYIANGDVFITGRIKDIIIRAGQHVYPQELEEAVGDIAGATKGAVAAFGVSDRASGTERIVLLAETAQTAAAELESLKARARAVVTEIIGSPPDDIVFVEPGTVPKTSSGKIRRAAAKEHYLAQQLTVPRRALKWQIARLWLGGIGGRLTRLGEAAREYLYAAWWWGILSICVAIGGIAVWILPRRKFVAEPSAILADEPTASLDAANGREIMVILSTIAKKRGRAVLVVTHDSRLFSFADKILRIEDGALTGEEPTIPQPSLPLKTLRGVRSS